MKFIEVDLDGTVVRAQLGEDKAPKTCQAIWEALPFAGRAVHAQISGDMFRMLDQTPVGDLGFESRISFQYPGQIIYFPPIKEIAFCLGEARFRGYPGPGPIQVTPLADIEGDFSAFHRVADALPRTGARPIQFRRAADQETSFRHHEPKGRKIEVEFDDLRIRATLLEEVAPQTTAAFARALPLEGQATSTVWSGQMTRFWGPDGDQGEIPLEITEPENGKQLHWPGYIYYYPRLRGVRICYGDGQLSGPWTAATMTPLAKFEGDWSRYREQALAQLTEGEKRMAFRLVTAG